MQVLLEYSKIGIPFQLIYLLPLLTYYQHCDLFFISYRVRIILCEIRVFAVYQKGIKYKIQT